MIFKSNMSNSVRLTELALLKIITRQLLYALLTMTETLTRVDVVKVLEEF